MAGARPPGKYGIDAPGALIAFAIAALLTWGLFVMMVIVGWARTAVWLVFPALIFTFVLVSYLRTTRQGKFEVWAELLDSFALLGDERVVDLGCGRGAVLIMVAQRVPRGHVIGVDPWRGVDQSGNDLEATLANADAAGVADRVQLETADLRELTLPDASADLVLSSLAIHNIKKDREQAVDHAVRICAPGGRICIVDIEHVDEYRDRLRELGLAPELRSAGRRMWFGGPMMASSIVIATKP